MSETKRALIFGISGQDGAYLSRFLLSKGYQVHGTSRDVETKSFLTLERLGVLEDVQLHSVSLLDFRNLLQVITSIEPSEIYNLAGQTSVGLSFSQPFETMESIAFATLEILEVLRYLKAPIRFYNASSSECFGDRPDGSACDETTPFSPRSPYATAKAAAHWATRNYRDAYSLFTASGILFNHESPLRPSRFVTAKIISTAVRIARGENTRLRLGDLSIARDWGYAEEYVEAMWLILQQSLADDFVIATGESHTLQEFVELVFATLSLDWKKYVDVDPALYRPSEIKYSRGNPRKSVETLGWCAKTKFQSLVSVLVEAHVRGFTSLTGSADTAS